MCVFLCLNSGNTEKKTKNFFCSRPDDEPSCFHFFESTITKTQLYPTASNTHIYLYKNNRQITSNNTNVISGIYCRVQSSTFLFESNANVTDFSRISTIS